MHVAALRGDMDQLKELCASQASLNVRSKGGYTPLHLAIRFGHLDAAQARSHIAHTLPSCPAADEAERRAPCHST